MKIGTVLVFTGVDCFAAARNDDGGVNARTVPGLALRLLFCRPYGIIASKQS